MEHSPSPSSSSSSSSHWIPNPLHVNTKLVYHLVFFVIGISLGIVASLYVKTISFPLQYFLTYHLTPPSISLPLPPPDPAMLAMSNTATSRTTKMSLLHNMTDQELIMEATKVRGVQGLHEKTNPKVAFLFLAKGALPFAPLWERFFKGHEGFYNIYLHKHPSFTETVPQDSVFYGRRIPSQAVFWGTPSMVDAERRLLATALLDISNQRFVLLSEACIPLFSFQTTYSYLTNSSLSFLNCFDDPTRAGQGRYSRKMQPTVNLTNWRKGSQWFELHRELALAVVSDITYYPIFEKHCVYPNCFMDEHYMPTFVHMVYPEMNSNRSVTRVDWPSKPSPHPRMYGRHDISEEFLNRLRFGSKCVYNGNVSTNMCFLFARKFHPNALEPLLRVAPLLLGIDS